MIVIRLFTFLTALFLLGCAALPMNGKPAFLAQTPIRQSQPPTTVPLTHLALRQNALTVVQKYNAAVAQKDIDAALALVAYDVMLTEIRAAPCPWQVARGQLAIESQLEQSYVLSFTAEDYQMHDNVITYTLTEWLDPRVVGPNLTQPVRSHMTAIVKNGEIANFILHRDSTTCEGG